MHTQIQAWGFQNKISETFENMLRYSRWSKDYKSSNTETNIENESIHV